MDKQRWFKAKRYGWGWYPCSWQGWSTLFVYLAAMWILGVYVDQGSHSISDTLIGMAFPFLVLSAGLILICYRTGEKPRWRWGGNV